MEYRPLNTEHLEIRLLTLIEGQHSAMVVCELRHYSLVDHPPYCALSYTWGNPDITKTIVVNGHKTQATVNLEAALRQMQADGYIYLWVDALCINQNDREERSLQVLRMRSIYAQAKAVLVWLGMSTENSNKAMTQINRLVEEKSAWRTFAAENIDKSSVEGVLPVFLNPFVEKEDLPPGMRFIIRKLDLNSGGQLGGIRDYRMSDQIDEGSKAALDELFDRPYWKRMWIIQEIVVAARENVIVYCGSTTTSMMKIEKFLEGTLEGKRILGSGQLPNFGAFRASHISSKTSPLIKLLISSRASLATDPRDKIYALLGLASDSQELVPTPNYKWPTCRVYEELTKSVLEVNRSPNILFFRSKDRAPEERLPSWVPDSLELARMNRPWHSSLSGPEGDKAYAAEVVSQFQQFLGTFSRRLSTMTRPHIEFDGKVLEMNGHVIDTVDGLSSQIGDSQIICQEEKRRRQMKQPVKNLTAYENDEETVEAIAQSLCMVGVDFGPDVGTGKSLRQQGLLVKLFGELFSSRGLNAVQKIEPGLQEWLKQNQSFSIDGQDLGDWIRHAKDMPASIGTLDWKDLTARTIEKALNKYVTRVAQVVRCGMRLMTTKAGQVGMVHPQAKSGDVLCSLLGCAMPVALRMSKDPSRYHVVGEAYLHPFCDFTPGVLKCDLSNSTKFRIE